MEIAAVIQGETLRAVRHGKVTIAPPLQGVAALDAVFHLDAASKVEVVLFTHFVSAAQHIAGELDIDKPGQVQVVVFQLRIRILYAFRRGLEVDKFVFIRCHDRFPLRVQDQVIVGHEAGVVEFFSECVLPSHETIAVARGCGKFHFVSRRIVARGNTSVTAVQIERDSVIGRVRVDNVRLFAFVAIAGGEDADRQNKATQQCHQ